ncbi:histone-like nucleoid-structuring protein Lsr2 [Nocardia amikacinitolerans]|uniref:histone-like nucleoid-structuring protein Lsr2 n=1 Tax=Nocardia amikacinitolerans TaxID=756689 RepID=UPI0020A4DF8D|nr:Lsr2 family protein [Nocardia amikacinitolerans]MCP2280932.1 Lsr2 protein [Nocardia amikacinitolerans]
MARKVVVTVVDDFDGRSQAAETVSFAVDGVGYEIDLSQENAARLRDVFAPWVLHGRRVGKAGRRSKNIESAGQATPQPGVVREWARANGYTVPKRGRVPANVVAAYEKAAS